MLTFPAANMNFMQEVREGIEQDIKQQKQALPG
jgi:hypothetical protein